MAEKILMLALSPTMQNGKIIRWHKKEGDTISNGQTLCEVETDKATMEYESPVDGTLLKILVKEGGSASIGESIAVSGKKGENIEEYLGQQSLSSSTAKAQVDPKPMDKNESIPHITESRYKASPLARKMAQDAHVPLPSVQGTGPEGRIVKKDIEKFLQENKSVPLSPIKERPLALSETKTVDSQRVPLSQKRKIIAQRLTQSKFTAPHYYLKTSIAVKTLLEARKKLNQSLTQKLSLNAFLVKFCAEALKRHPQVHSGWREDSIERFSQIDIGLAVAQNDGLITPVVRNCGAKGIAEIDGELKILVEKALSNRLLPEEFQNATFTISNLGSYGIEEFTAIINPPGSAILAVGEVKKQPVVIEDKVAVEDIMKVTLSCDHRVIDGAVGASFLKDLKEMIENPILAIL
ncbi:MAG: 2-oxo acid dehydrogenase subunit E2 [Candidatus Brocadiae bacterium]|nr:2-oxo acid dehydrogenase subunit E2 [Candidatus Brocadiia bacterium]